MHPLTERPSHIILHLHGSPGSEMLAFVEYSGPNVGAQIKEMCIIINSRTGSVKMVYIICSYILLDILLDIEGSKFSDKKTLWMNTKNIEHCFRLPLMGKLLGEG